MLKIALYLQTCKYRPVKVLYHWLLIAHHVQFDVRTFSKADRC